MDFEQSLNALQVKDLISVARALPDPTGDPVFRAYQPLLEFVRRCAQAKDTVSLLGIAHAIYGWMPTMLRFDEQYPLPHFWDEALSGSLDPYFLEGLRAAVNHSVVGASKVLHFINPADYAIFDSRVYWGIAGKAAYDYRVNHVGNFILYTERLRQLAGENLEPLRKILTAKNVIALTTSNLRALEVCLFCRNSTQGV